MRQAGSPRALRIALPIVATVAIVAPLAWLWQDSRVPAVYSVMDMGYPDYGVGAMADAGVGGHGGHMQGPMPEPPHGAARGSVTDMVADPARPADVRVDLVTRQQMLSVGGRSVPGFTVNGTSPGPEIRARQGQLIEVHLRNESVADGVTLHWHGLDVPNAMDGVAGVTQDAVPVGGEFTYRFVADQAGSYWYHSHQVSNPQVAGGLLGSLVVMPKSGHRPAGRRLCDRTHLRGCADRQRQGRGSAGAGATRAAGPGPGHQHRQRAHEDLDQRALPAARCRRHRRAPTQRDLRPSVTLTAGGRADLEVQVPTDGTAGQGATVQGDRGGHWPPGADAPVPPQPAAELDLLSYGSPAPLGFDPAHPTRRFEYRIGRRPGFVKGRPGDVVVHQRPPLSERPHVCGTPGRRGS